MQELIQIIKKRQEDDEAIPFMYNDKIIELAESLLEKEKEMMCEFVDDFINDRCDGFVSSDCTTEEYYDEAFKAEKNGSSN